MYIGITKLTWITSNRLLPLFLIDTYVVNVHRYTVSQSRAKYSVKLDV
jgi:hypothetical protein